MGHYRMTLSAPMGSRTQKSVSLDTIAQMVPIILLSIHVPMEPSMQELGSRQSPNVHHALLANSVRLLACLHLQGTVRQDITVLRGHGLQHRWMAQQEISVQWDLIVRWDQLLQHHVRLEHMDQWKVTK